MNDPAEEAENSLY